MDALNCRIREKHFHSHCHGTWTFHCFGNMKNPSHLYQGERTVHVALYKVKLRMQLVCEYSQGRNNITRKDSSIKVFFCFFFFA
ncbi:hypothetical protein EXN66_Car001952 [Channa argus]|uniref:Uncharacterized protein n=1 Tax=Channa argus TaxID=215402 RepID=A0A6G1P7K3_CHAAH|nr:hypothetical protein EXN66_Car001952 [Channa argus]